ncbi:GNAT family N-acetyltransferase [Frankia sp. AgB1.9]|uniref:GNAT family N-acetyltransferase n=1 Tax=unclassified Frankia TaxID=2632575 RepID=UPI00193243FB|nr:MULTISPECIES: GNAT family N-acetyltransferase [unclassified Frankia]MBL7491619.1 GNAT family N-acetyltransferase [Frankia sp. AgW1.1]MBL7553836.1 GNAT family N-acetyltransferase [Frankia sp. AgB1.9]MBL7618081.1 GNAT family N-acetyltransferase [Frankia sp. AgB1.8]
MTSLDLVTARLILRPITAADVADVVATSWAAGRPDHWADDYPDDGDQGIAELLNQRPELLGPRGHRQIIEQGRGLVVGGIGLFWPPVDGRIEIGYGVVPSRRGLGYATEATLALVEFAFTLPGVRTIYADVDRLNRPSIRVLVKADFLHGETNGDLARFHRDAPAVEATN